MELIPKFKLTLIQGDILIMKKTVKLSMILLAFALICPTVHAKKKMSKKEKAQAPAMEAQMKEMMARTTPNENHKILESLVGTFNAEVKNIMVPNAPAQVSNGTSVQEMMFGGRFLKQTFNGNFSNQPFSGVGYTGYDLVRGEYQGIWLDNFMTGIMEATGQYDAATKTINMGCTFGCPMTGEKDRWSRSEWTMINPDKNVYKSYSKDKDGNEFMSMEITYTRAK